MSDSYQTHQAIAAMQRRGMTPAQCADFCQREYGKNCLKLSYEQAADLQERVRTWPSKAHTAFMREQIERGQATLPGLS